MNLTTILVVVFAVLLIVVMILIFGAAARPTKKEVKKEQPKAEEKSKESEEQEKKDDELPEILVEVTRRNYMHERAVQQTQSHEFTIDDAAETKQELVPKKQFHRIQPIEDDEQDMTTHDILATLDREESGDSSPKNNTIAKEIRGMSPKMKAIILADALKRKDDKE